MAGADISRDVRLEGGKGDDAVLETVARIGGKLARSEEGGEAVMVESLRELQRMHMTFEVLEATKIGRAVNVLRKNAPSEQARRLAAELYTGWKALADESFKSSRAQSPPPKADEGIKKRSSSSSPPPPLPVNAKQSGRPDSELEMAPTSVVVEVTLEAKAKLHPHEVFDDSAAIVKKPMSLLPVAVINSTNAPAKAEQRRVTVVVRRTAAAAASNSRQNSGGSKQQANCLATADAKRASATSASPLTTAKPPTTALPKTIGSSGACKRKAEPAAVFDEARLARARLRLVEGYKEVSAAKEKRKIKEIKGIDAVRMEKKARHRFVRHVRCTAAHRTGMKQAPVPCHLPRMPRAF